MLTGTANRGWGGLAVGANHRLIQFTFRTITILYQLPPVLVAG